jgi:nucleoid DNA-binding protein
MASATKEDLAVYLAARQHCRVSQAIDVVEIVLAGVLHMLNEHGRLEIREFGAFTVDPGGRKRRKYNIATGKVTESKSLPRILFRSSKCLFEKRRGQRPQSLFEEYFG